MDKEDFQAWKDSQATQWVLSRLEQWADRVAEDLGQALMNSVQLEPAQWASLQARAAYDRGVIAALNQIVTLEYKEIEDEK